MNGYYLEHLLLQKFFLKIYINFILFLLQWIYLWNCWSWMSFQSKSFIIWRFSSWDDYSWCWDWYVPNMWLFFRGSYLVGSLNFELNVCTNNNLFLNWDFDLFCKVLAREDRIFVLEKFLQSEFYSIMEFSCCIFCQVFFCHS